MSSTAFLALIAMRRGPLDCPALAPGKRTLTQRLPGPKLQLKEAATRRQQLDRAWAEALEIGESETHERARRGTESTAESLPFVEQIQASFGPEHDLSGVFAHTGSAARGAAESIGAKAYAMGEHIVFAGEPDLHTAAHEAAHVVQQRGGVQLKGAVGTAGDPYEVQADRVADAVVRGESAAALLAAAANGGNAQTAVQAKKADSTAEAVVVGHASPRWEKLRGGTRAELNLDLSRERAGRVRSELQSMFDQQLVARGLRVPDALPCIIRCEDHELDVHSSGVGYEVTEHENPGDPSANDASMRRVEVYVTITRQITDQVETEPRREDYTPEKRESNATRDWAVKVSVSAGAHFVVGGGVALVRLKNRLSGQEHDYLLAHGGGGLGFGSGSGADPGWGDWTEFRTVRPLTLKDWDGELAMLHSAAIGLAVGYSITTFSAPKLGVRDVDVSGPGVGMVGADYSQGVGMLIAQGEPPDDFSTEPASRVATDAKLSKISYGVPLSFRHVAYFATESSNLSEKEHARLMSFVETLARAYDGEE